MYLGHGRTGGWSFAGPQRSTLVLGPSRSGKTSSLVIPNLLLAEGPVVSTSTKPDVMRATAPARGRHGWTLLFDPGGDVDCPPSVERVGWSPLTSARDWDTAVQTADAMVVTARGGHLGAARSGGEHHWSERAGALLAPLLHAAALELMPMRAVLKWIDRHDGATPLEILAQTAGADSTPADVLAGIVATDAREQSGIWSTASGVLSAYRSRSVLASTELAPLDATAFCSGAHTLYICATGQRQHLLAPLVVAAIGEVRDTTYRMARERDVRALAHAPSTLLALDEVANIAPLPDLPAILSEGAGQGLLVLACLQDLSQARARWGDAASGFLTLFGTTVVLPGIADVATLRDLSALAGEHEVPSTTLSQRVGRRGRLEPARSVGSQRVPRLAVDELARGTPGHALVLTPGRTFGSVALTPSHTTSPWRELTAQRDERAPLTRAQPGRLGQVRGEPWAGERWNGDATPGSRQR